MASYLSAENGNTRADVFANECGVVRNLKCRQGMVRLTDVSCTLTMRTRAPRWIGDRDTGRCSPWLVPKIEGGEQPVGLAD